MTYIENIFVCLAVPLLLSLFFTRGGARKFAVFLVLGMLMCLLSAYISSFFMGYLGVDTVVTAIEITPVCEEAMKLLPVLFYLLIFEPTPRALPAVAIAVSVGFATFENVCYLAENGAEDLSFLLVRGFSAGALHVLCGIVCGYGIAYVFRRRFLTLTGTVGIFGFCTGFHAIYNLLVTADGAWRAAGYLFPSLLIALLYTLSRLLPQRERHST